MVSILNPTSLVKHYGYFGIFLMLFAESGIIIGFFLPGDSLLFTAGLLASQHYLNIVVLIIVSIAAAILGNATGFFTGKRLGPSLFDRKNSKFLSPKRIHEAHAFFEKEGGRSLILARFIPAIRTFVPIVAGIGEMPFKTFFTFNAAGGLIWGIVVPLLGYTLGKTVKNIDKYLLPVILLIIIISALPVVYSYYKARSRNSSQIKQ